MPLAAAEAEHVRRVTNTFLDSIVFNELTALHPVRDADSPHYKKIMNKGSPVDFKAVFAPETIRFNSGHIGVYGWPEGDEQEKRLRALIVAQVEDRALIFSGSNAVTLNGIRSVNTSYGVPGPKSYDTFELSATYYQIERR